MIKVIAGIFSLTALCYVPFAFSGEYDDVKDYGFTLVANNENLLHLKFRERFNIMLSKKRFYNATDAREFCKKYSIPFNNSITGSLLLGMSGVAKNHPFIMKSIAFNFVLPDKKDHNQYSGAWAWLNNKSNIDMVSIYFDGHGEDMEEMSVSEINAKFHTDASLPAICTDIKRNFASKMHSVG